MHPHRTTHHGVASGLALALLIAAAGFLLQPGMDKIVTTGGRAVLIAGLFAVAIFLVISRSRAH